MSGPRVAIVGVGELPPRRTTPGRTTLGLIAEAAARALDDAGLDKVELDGLVVGPHVGETPQHVPATVAEYLGMAPRYCGSVDLGGATACAMIRRAAAVIAAGMARTVLCVLGNARHADVPVRSPNRNPIREFEVPYGASGANQAYAMIAQRHMYEFGTRPEQLARIPVAARENAQLNPAAVFHGEPLTVDEVMASPLVMAPLRLLEIVMPCGGAAALVVSDQLNASHRPVFLRGSGELVTHRALTQAPALTESPLKAAIDDAYREAGVGPHDLDLLSLYDCYSIMAAITLEDAGIVAKGRVGPWLLEQDLSHQGDVPLNTHGGQLGCGQADLAGGMAHVVEAVWQLRGEGGDRQIPDCALALVTGNGATMSEEVALILEGAS